MNAAPDRYVLRTVLIVALGGFLMGFDVSVISGVVSFIEPEFALGKIEVGWAAASLTLSATLSILCAGPLADRFGRRAILRAAAVVFTVSALLSAAASSFSMFIAGRLLSGVGVGAALVVAPMYIAELSPAAARGRMVSFNQLFIVLGISAAFFSNYFILKVAEAQWNWRWMLGIGALPSSIYFALLWTVPESPRWLALRGKLDAARRVLSRAHGAALAEAELDEVRASLAREARMPGAAWRELGSSCLRGVMIIGLSVGVLQQITGINAVLSYAPIIFQGAGANADAAFMQAAYVGVVNLVFTVLAMLLIDRLGRRPLLMIGTAGIALSMGVIAFAPSLVLVGVLAFVASFAVSLGPIMWVLLSEIFPNRVRAVAISFIGLVNSGVSFLVQLLFPWELANFGNSGPWMIYAAFALIGFVVIWRILPETRGRSLEELEATLVRHA
jgi:SP family arabinose:H+ symporter-like MFS transporter